jgi:hypothetical protein
MASSARLPGIYFETVPAPPPALLPRMDVAGFAGFLPSGPIGLPFEVDSSDRFQEIFGTDLTLAWDARLQQMRLAQTSPAVRAFFRNGGKTCWVLRLAQNALSNAWTIPGLLQVDQSGHFHAGWVLARSEGSWSDNLTVNATLLESPLPQQASGWPGNGSVPKPPGGLNPGDLAQFFFPGTQNLAYFDQSSCKWFWFQPALSTINSPLMGQPTEVWFLGPGSDAPVPYSSFAIENGEILLGVSRDTALTISPGSWLRFSFGGQTMLAQIGGIEAGLVGSGSPPNGDAATLTSALAWWSVETAAGWAANRGQPFQASIVTFELWAWPQGSQAMQISGLGFSEENPAYWGLLPADAVLYAPVTRPAPLPYAALSSQIDNPRFPLAGPTTADLGLPLGMTAIVDPDLTQGATQPGQTALDRDGLAQFNQGLFLDSRLAACSTATLLTEAFYWQYQAPDPSPLSGIHALLETEQISMIAVPDAIHSGWQRAAVVTPTLGLPDPVKISTPAENGSYTVSWSYVAGASGYSVDSSTDPQFATPTLVTSQDAGPATQLTISSNSQCPLVLYYRVSAYGSAGFGPWSKTVSVDLGTGDFSPCIASVLTAPSLQLFPEKNRIVLDWGPAANLTDSFTLETSDDPRFEAGVETLYQGQDTSFTSWTAPGPPSYFRVSVQSGSEPSPWSNTVSTTAVPPSPWVVVPFPPYSPSVSFTPPAVLTAVHTAMLVMAGARADMVAILSLPYSYRKSEALAYQANLLNVLSDDPLSTLPSYGALYHPWVVMPDNTNPAPQSLRNIVPDGPVCAAIASTTLSSGAWIAPANVAIPNAVALTPLESDAALAFFNAQINLIAPQPEGFMITSQDTLMTAGANPPLEPLNVRRLLILLRRLALREGTRYVFQNNSNWLQRAVSRQFDQWMQLLLARGAFAGSTAEDSYQVIADSTVNTQQSMDQGQFIVVLRIAPSAPMQFLTVKLVQSGGQLALVEG